MPAVSGVAKELLDLAQSEVPSLSPSLPLSLSPSLPLSLPLALAVLDLFPFPLPMPLAMYSLFSCFFQVRRLGDNLAETARQTSQAAQRTVAPVP